jgi:GPH family glycoside/pentoside/hexuronide:cation symporter
MIPLLIAIGTARPGAVVPVYAMAAVLGFGIATAYVTPWSMIPDVIAWDAHTTGTRREASYYAVISFFQKAGTAGALWLMAQALERSGYRTPAAANLVPDQPGAALSVIRHLISTVPSILLVGAIAFAVFYPISRTVHASLTAPIRDQTAD